MAATDTEIRNTFQNLRRMLAQRFGEQIEDSVGWARMAYRGVLLAEQEFDEAVREHITVESLGDHS